MITTMLTTPPTHLATTGWTSDTLNHAANLNHTGSMNWVFLGSVIIGIVTALFAYIGITQIASSRRGDVRQAGRQSAVAAIGTFWVALAIGGFTTLLVSGVGSFLTSVFGQ
ncbi:hypothetical protein [Dermatophilus congolensis]|uniref:hypothetical protein n=1 Tax=Dermatophilus congolensis TaxID=1863 RepID=UPI000E0EF47B|nr:hypothetical protein [Dermatophilus congolensis]